MAVVKNANLSDATSATTHVFTVAAPGIAAGNVAVIVGVTTAGNRTINSATDSRGNTWQVDRTDTNGANNTGSVISSRLATALQSGDTITITLASAGVFAGTLIDLGNDLVTSSWRDVVTGFAATTASTAVGSGTGATSAQANEIQLGVCINSGSAVTTTPEVLSPVWNLIDTVASPTTIRTLKTYYRVVTAVEARAFNATLSSSLINTGMLVTYKQTGGAPAGADLAGTVAAVSAATSDLTLAPTGAALAGQADAAAAVTADLSAQVPAATVSGTVAATSAVSGDLSPAPTGAALAATVSAVSAVVGDLAGIVAPDLAGTVSSVSSATADLSPGAAGAALAGTVAAVSGGDADLTLTVTAALAGQVANATSVSADLTILPGGFPLSVDPVIAQFYEDLNTGCVYELDPVTNVYNEVYCPDTAGGGGYTPDLSPPDVPVIKYVASVSEIQENGTSITTIRATVGYPSPPAGLTDLDGFVMESTRVARSDDATLPDWVYATQWSAVSLDAIGAADTVVVQPGVHAAENYWLRAAAVDKSGNRSGWSTVVAITTASDLDGPPQPSNIVTEGGMSVIGIRWDPIEASDLSYVEVQWRQSSPVGEWNAVRVEGTLVVVGATNDITYDIRLRSVDTSGNTLHDTGTVDTDGNPIFATVKAVDQPEQGWVTATDATPTALPGSALVWDSAMIADVFAGELNADWITAGSLRVGGSGGNASAIEVFDSAGEPIGRWDTDGITVLDPTNEGYSLVITEAGLSIWDRTDPANPIEVVRMTPLGIDAGSITFGSARGGHNLVQNSSFEMGAFGVSAIVNNVWDVTADWNATRLGTDTNITVGASTLTMTAV